MASLLEPKPILFPGEADLRDNLLGYIKKYSDASKNAANMTPLENESLGFLSEYLGSGEAPTLAAAGQEILKTLRGEYNPETSAYYAPVIEGIEGRRDQARDRLRRSSQIGGNLTSLARVRAEADSDTEYEAQIADLMLNLQQNERNRMLGVIPQALQYGQYVEEGPLRKARAAVEGDIPRQLEQGAINVGQGVLTGYRPSYYFEPTDDYLSMMLGGNQKKSGGFGGFFSGALKGATAGSALGPVGSLIGAGAGGLMGYFG